MDFFCVKFVSSQYLKYFFKSNEVLLSAKTVDKDVIEEDNDKFSKEIFKDIIHENLKSGWGISETERIHLELIMALM